MHLNFIEARVVSDKIVGGRVALLLKHDDGKTAGTCSSCKKQFRFDKPQFETIQELACCRECAQKLGFYDHSKRVLAEEQLSTAEPERKPSKTVEIQKEPDCCQCCHGPRVGKGYKHLDDCKLKASNKIVKKKEQQEPCKECGGPRSKNGWHHKPDCSLKASNKIAAKRENIKRCPECDGPAIGRGFRHNENCPVKLKKAK